MDSLITTIVIVVIAAIATWFKKLGQPQNTDEDSRMRRSVTMPRPNQPGQPRPSSTPRPQSGPVSWEEELRRLLEGGTPAAPPPMRPPPVVITQAPRAIQPAPPPLMRPTFAPSPRPVPVIISPPPVPIYGETRPRELANLQESSTAYERASALDTTVAQYMQGVSDNPVQLTTVVRNQTSPELLRAISLFQNARSARQAIIASIILGPPKALEQPAADF
jgi:hypothetical protein